MKSSSSMTHFNTFDDEPPLLEELGINPKQVIKNSLSVLKGFNINAESMDDGDVSGTFLYSFALGCFHLLAGKFQFGDILGLMSVGLVALYWLLNVMAGAEGGIELNRVSAMVGYCMFPMVIYAGICVVVPSRSLAGVIIAVIATLWCSIVCAKILVAATPSLKGSTGLVLFPCLLFFSVFTLLTV
eukprot:CAMPEP_0197849092 /NCGR_PEP_ID=MMETSP1438-20131217/10875_1 /TAXON_ID=1461541 /ORGANISM="Pterosperma sp., Strain CCMP1384" /LENGTH=185 /DNA_ID=CAMNT_0043461617 /DNA_START=305 /DNA_END=862 /DNA_ORIENTATION=+